MKQIGLAVTMYVHDYNKPGGAQDKRNVPHNDSFTFAYADGHAKWMNVSTFLGKCPLAAQYTAPAFTFITNAGSGRGENTQTTGTAPTWSQPFPFWGLY